MYSARIDMTGKVYGRLTVLSYSHTIKKRAYWLCVCECGETKTIHGTDLRLGHTKSCGCLKTAEETIKKRSENRKGKFTGKRSPELCKKMSEARKGIVFSEEHKKNLSLSHKGHVPWNKSKINVYSEESLGRFSKAHIGEEWTHERRINLSKAIKGENHWNWNPNLPEIERTKRKREYTEYRFWRTDVYRRDGYICQKCGRKQSKQLRAHHIESYANNSELRVELSNGITLCKDCHDNLHHRFGYGNNTRIQMEIFMNTYKEVCSGGA